MKFKVGDRVRLISEDVGAPVGLLGTVVSVEGRIVPYRDDTFEFFPYVVKYDRGQHPLVDLLFPDGTPEHEEGLEHA